MASSANFFSRMLGGGKGTAGRTGLNRTLNTTAGRAVGGLGAAIGIGSSASMLFDKDKKNDAAGWWGLGGAAVGGLLGSFLGPGGTLMGMSLGSMAGQGIGSMLGGKQHGGPITGGNPHLVGETGPEIVMTKANSNVLSNSDSKRMFNTENLERQLTALVASQAAANKIHSQHLDSVNTQTMMTAKIKVATETTARQDRNRVGLV